MTPDASEELADPVVCDMLASRIVVDPRNLRAIRKNPTVMTATGIDVDTVMPASKPRYALAAPKRIPNMTPMITALKVNSAELMLEAT